MSLSSEMMIGRSNSPEVDMMPITSSASRDGRDAHGYMSGRVSWAHW